MNGLDEFINFSFRQMREIYRDIFMLWVKNENDLMILQAKNLHYVLGEFIETIEKRANDTK